jgi:hypothetical protein
MRPLYISFYSYFLYILTYLHPWYTTYYLRFLYNLPNSITSISITGLTVNIKDVVGIKTKDIKDHITKNHNTEDIIEIIIETRPERNIISITRKDISL